MELTRDELDLIRQWFNAVEDMNKKYLTADDYILRSKILKHLGVNS